MTDPATQTDIALIVRRTIRAPATRVFTAWTTPEHLRRWWGPAGVRCTAAEIDLRVGGAWRIANQRLDGSVVWISGEFLEVEPPHRLVYTWRLGPDAAADERVTVRFEPRDDATEVIVVHERIASPGAREGHENGWIGCLDGLDAYFARGPLRSPHMQ